MRPVALTKEGGGRAIDPSEILSSVRSGEVVVAPRAMQRIGMHRDLVEATSSAIRDACGDAAAEEIERRGLEQLHEVLEGAPLERAAHEVDRRLVLLYPRLMKAIGREVLGLKRPFYVPFIPVMRLSVPNEGGASQLQDFSLEKSPVLLSRYPPHRDSWFISPINTLNAWIAIGTVTRENGLYVYPDMWGEEVTFDERDGRDFGTPLTFALEPGDVALFDNRQLHASADNVGGSTRLALSGRICPEFPIAPRADALEVVSLWSPLIGTRFERFAGAATRVSWVYAIERLKRRATRALIAMERRTGRKPLPAVQEALRYRRADRPFGLR
jgi:hypothetical protein